jgi:hypothetical protein
MVMAADAGVNVAFGERAQIDCAHLAVWVVEIATRRIVRKPCKACQEMASVARRVAASDRLAS